MKINVLNANVEHDIGKWIYLNTIHKYKFIEIEMISLT